MNADSRMRIGISICYCEIEDFIDGEVLLSLELKGGGLRGGGNQATYRRATNGTHPKQTQGVATTGAPAQQRRLFEGELLNPPNGPHMHMSVNTSSGLQCVHYSFLKPTRNGSPFLLGSPS
jgi:hypothetical protein